KIIKPAVDIISFCLMPNHFHFVFKQLNEDGITNFMRRICTSYTKYFNKRQDRVGGLFQGRFKSVKVESDEQLIHVTRYQHINPQKLGLDSVNQLIEYPWSSLNTYLARRDFYSFLNTDLVLGEFGSREEYKKFTEAEIDQFGVMRLKDVAIDDDFGWFRKFEELDKNQKAELVEQYKEMAY
ncbi:MAG: transposase, partial [Patescibacteria group bacterium]